jgi:hypothetical protein
MKYAIKHGITQSMLSSFIDCPKRFWLSLQGYRTASINENQNFGTLMHYLLECNAEAIQSGISGIPVPALKNQFIKKYPQNDMQAFELNFAKALCLLQGYKSKWDVVDSKKDKLQAEAIFDVNWHGFRLRGMRDELFYIKDKIWIRETKTTSEPIEAAFESKLNYDFQTLFYVVATEQELGESVTGILYDVIHKPTIRQKQSESIVEYSERLRSDIAEDPDKYFARYEIALDKNSKNEFKIELLYKLKMCKKFIEKPIVYKNESACKKRWNCEFIPACGSGSMAGYLKDKKLFGELQ